MALYHPSDLADRPSRHSTSMSNPRMCDVCALCNSNSKMMSVRPAASPQPEPKHSPDGRFRTILVLSGVALVAEAIGAAVTDSLALVLDAAHRITICAAILVALTVDRLKRSGISPAGHVRFHLANIRLATLSLAVALAALAYAVYETYAIVMADAESLTVRGAPIFATAAVALLISVIGLCIVPRGNYQRHRARTSAALWLSALSSGLAVASAAAETFIKAVFWFDFAAAIASATLLLTFLWSWLRDGVATLAGGLPGELNLADVRNDILKIPRVDSIHALEPGADPGGSTTLSVHVVSARGNHVEVTGAVTQLLREHFLVEHVTVQVEKAACDLGRRMTRD